MDVIVLDGPATLVKMHPVVAFSVVDHFLRRSDDLRTVYGILLGHVSGTTMEITSVVPIKHSIGGTATDPELLLNPVSIKRIVELHKEAESSEVEVGWFAVTDVEGRGINDQTLHIHQFFRSIIASACPNPMHLAVDVSLARDAISFYAYAIAGGEALRSGLGIFQQLPLVAVASDAERVGLDALVAADTTVRPEAMIGGAALAAMAEAAYGPSGASAAARSSSSSSITAVAAINKGSIVLGRSTGRVSSLPSDLAATTAAIERLHSLIAHAHAYVADVTAGRRAADPAVGMRLSEALAAVPRLPPRAFAQSFGGALQDLLMTGFLTSLAETQLALAERISSAVPFS